MAFSGDSGILWDRLGRRALELAVEALLSAGRGDPALSDSDPENHRNAARILAHLARIYREQVRQEEAQDLLAQARRWAPELFEAPLGWE